MENESSSRDAAAKAALPAPLHPTTPPGDPLMPAKWTPRSALCKCFHVFHVQNLMKEAITMSAIVVVVALGSGFKIQSELLQQSYMHTHSERDWDTKGNTGYNLQFSLPTFERRRSSFQLQQQQHKERARNKRGHSPASVYSKYVLQ